jgi:glycosyltransferase involved in cell wall biosynthesis
VTVVVASYNHAEYLPRRMASLLAQTYADLEIIVIDDRSPDNSVEVLRRYESDPRVTLVVREKNAGWVAVSNQGIAMASGEYVLFANCDDACEPRMVERLVDAMTRHPSAGIAFCRSLFVDEHDKVLGEDLDIQEPAFQARCATDTLLERREMSRFLLHACVIPNLSAALFRSESFARVGALSSDFKACSDWELFFRIAREYDVAYVAEPLNLFRQHATTIRSVMKERDTYDEYFTLLLSEARTLPLSTSERMRARLRVMDLWSTHLIGRSSGGWANFSYHLGRVMRHDPAALLLLVPALARRVVALVGKVLTASRGMLADGRAR